MPEIVKVYKQSIPAVKFIGRKYGDDDRVNGSFASQWQQWIEQRLFDPIEQAAGGIDACKQLMEDGEAALGFMRYKEGEPFQYWIGMFTPPDTEVPETYDFIMIQPTEAGICWLKGKEPDIYAKEDRCMAKLAEEGMQIHRNKEGAMLFFERYAMPRFDERDEQGNIILDIGFILHQ